MSEQASRADEVHLTQASWLGVYKGMALGEPRVCETAPLTSRPSLDRRNGASSVIVMLGFYCLRVCGFERILSPSAIILGDIVEEQ